MRADHAWNDEDKPEKAEAMQRRDRAVRLDLVHGLQSGPDVDAEAKQPGDYPKTR